MRRPYLRALLASAAAAAAFALAGCEANSIAPTGRAQAPLSEKTLSLIAEKKMDKESPILVRIFKEEAELEVWKQTRDGQYALLKTYPICRWAGVLGPKIKEGDRQAPEGFYSVGPGQMNPNSSYYLSFNTGFPNAFDRAWGRTGTDLMVHGDCSSAGCYSMTDEQIQEIYALARESFFGGQKAFQLQAFPFRLTALNMAKHRDNPNFAFWKMLKQGYDHFSVTRREPKIAVCEKRYVFDAVAPENASRPLSFNARGQCPVYRLDPTIADAVLEQRRQEEFKMAQHIADRVATVPIQTAEGGMNPVFLAKLGGADASAASGSAAPGALPRVASAPASTIKVAQATPAPLPNEGATPEKPTAVASLFGDLFGGKPEAEKPAAAPETEKSGSEPVALRGSNTELAARPRRSASARTAGTPVSLPPKPAAKPTAVARNISEPKPKPETKPQVEQAAAQPTPQKAAPQVRSAFTDAPRPATNGMLSGAQPVVPAGSFDARWAGLR